MAGYDAAAWSDFAVAVAGAAAALSGLLFVAVSINIERILAYSGLPARAGQTLIMLVMPLAVSTLILVPGQPTEVLAAELLSAAALCGLLFGRLNRPATKAREEGRAGYLAARLGPSLVVPVLLALAGVTLLIGSGGGLYWLPGAVLLGFLSGLGNAWVLLVEILR